MLDLAQGRGLARRLLRAPARFVRRRVLPGILPPKTGQLRGPVNSVRVIGLLSQASGIGQSARLCIEQLRSAGLLVETCDLSKLLATDDGAWPRRMEGGRVDHTCVNIFVLNPPMLLPAIMASGLSRYYSSYNVGYWAWELEALPAEWITALGYLDAVLVPSTFCRDAVRRYTSKPVIVVPHPVRQPVMGPVARKPGEPFRVLSIFNFGSSLVRKNPEALIDAFEQAFMAGSTNDVHGVELILKTGDGARHPDALAKLKRRADVAQNVRIIDEIWSDEELSRGYHAADLYASLHRSEGFGLTIAEAIMHDVPVMATDWSGCRDVCLPRLSYPVDYRLVPFRDEHGDYSQVSEARWAEPIVASAVAQLRAARSDPVEAKRRASALKAHLINYLRERSYVHALSELAAQGAPAGGTA